ncbi:MAG: hypothetical protein LBU02_04500 [Rickettsiales bacterium]|jgi:hypothetical protein|nr:hypothetical protein [Rickettsiales bacterium]
MYRFLGLSNITKEVKVNYIRESSDTFMPKVITNGNTPSLGMANSGTLATNGRQPVRIQRSQSL